MAQDLISTTGNIEEVAIAWLKGQSGVAAGMRVLVYTYGNVGYLGALDTCSEFVQRHHVEEGRILESELTGCKNEDERRFTLECGRLIKDLCDSGRLREVPAPRQYGGSAVLFVQA